MPYTIGIIGTGYVGLVSGACFAENGNTVYCIDVDSEKVERMQRGETPIYEPGLEVFLQRNLRENRLRFSTSLETAVHECSILFLCLPTPPNEDGSADINYVLNTVEDICTIIEKDNIESPRIIVTRSTVPVGTAEKVRNVLTSISPNRLIDIASNPEFLREGFAVDDTMKPDRIVIGTQNESTKQILLDLYQPFVRSSGNPVLVMDEKSAEVTKYAANSFLATKISFMNDLSAYCEKVGVNIDNVRVGIGTDTRIGKKFIYAGVGYGGSCFPKDVRALIHSARQVETPLLIVEAVEDVNRRQIERFTNRIVEHYSGNLRGKTIAFWGLAFKPNTDDTREAPAFYVIKGLLEQGANVQCYDPEAIEPTRNVFANSITYAPTMYAVLEGADVLVIVTDWNEFRNPDFAQIRTLLKSPVIFDGRNMYPIDRMEQEGFYYYSVGRPTVQPKP